VKPSGDSDVYFITKISDIFKSLGASPGYDLRSKNKINTNLIL